MPAFKKIFRQMFSRKQDFPGVVISHPPEEWIDSKARDFALIEELERRAGIREFLRRRGFVKREYRVKLLGLYPDLDWYGDFGKWKVLHGVRALASLSEYPLQTQERLCQVAWYTSVPPKRVILRQGHLPECFYFILSGMGCYPSLEPMEAKTEKLLLYENISYECRLLLALAYVKKVTPSDSTGESSMNIAARLTKGQSFGLYEYDDNGNVEVGLVFNTQRTATVESATDMELLTIAREDFFKIFMNADNPEEEAEHIKFLRQIPVMKNWPVDEIKNEPGSCLLHYFKRGSLITENIKSSDWLYVVKQGAVEVIKKLRAVKPHSSRAHRPQSHPLCDVVYPYLGLADAAPRVNTGRKRPETSYVNREVYESMERYYDKLRDEARKDVDSRESIKLPRIKIDVVTNENVDRCHDRRIGGYEKEADSVKTPPIVNFTIPSVKSEIIPGKPGSSHSTFKPSTAKCSKDHFLLPTSSDLRKSFTSSSECYFKNPETCRNPEYVFIKIERLGVKGIVGLNWLEFKEDGDIYEKSPTACLVSQGAEVLMLSKKLFVKHANDKVKIKLRDIVRPYPKDEKLQENLQIQTDWDCYKNNMLSSLSMRRSLTTVG